MGYGKVASQLISGVGGAVAGGLNAGTQNDIRAQQLGAYANLPAAPNYLNLFTQGNAAQAAMTPGMVQADNALRQQIAPGQQQAALHLYQQYMPQYNAANLAELKKVDPQYMQGYQQMGAALSSDLAAGSSLTPAQLSLANSYVNAGQAERGNVLGNANVAGNALYDANAGNALYQQRLGNMSSYLSSGGPESRFSAIGGNAAAGALSQGVSGLTNPGMEYYQIPQNQGNTYMQAGQTGWQEQDQNAMAQAQAAYSAVPEVNPWIASLSAGFGALAGNSSAGSVPSTGAAPGGGGMNLQGMLGSYLGGSGDSSAGNSQGSMFGGGADSPAGTQLGDQASPAYL